MPDVPPPESVNLTYNEFSRLNGEGDDWDGESRPMDIRYIDAPAAPRGEPGPRTGRDGPEQCRFRLSQIYGIICTSGDHQNLPLGVDLEVAMLYCPGMGIFHISSFYQGPTMYARPLIRVKLSRFYIEFSGSKTQAERLN